jgi:hypothetical protein
MSGNSGKNTSRSFSGEMDPEVADLIGLDESDDAPDDTPGFSELFGEPLPDDNNDVTTPDLTSKGFTRPQKTEQAPKPYFSDKEYYKTILTGEGDISKKVHSLLGSFLNAKDSQDRSMYRGKLIPAYWQLAEGIAGKLSRDIPLPKRLCIRFGVLLPTMISAEQRDILSRVIMENATGEPIHYVDEWIVLVARGRVNASATDETKAAARDTGMRLNAMLEKTRGRYDAQLSLIRQHTTEMEHLEESLGHQTGALQSHSVRNDLDNIREPYDDGQKSAMSEANSILRRLSIMNRDLERHIKEAEDLRRQLDELSDKEESYGTETLVDTKTVIEEFRTIRQMNKLSVGRQGNHFPLLMKQYFRGSLMDLGTRENIINILADSEYLDPGIFLRTFKQQTNRIVPNVILLPCYGEDGVCWEPFERFNRASSRGRLAIPMYPKDIRTAAVAALGDLRWQVAKEKAQHYWMEEGLTGWYYQWFSERRMKGDVKDSFVQDYILWITKESEGTQKLDRDVRDIFWRYIPFPQDVKDKLKNRGYVYNELYKKDINRSMSDGY